MTDALGDKKDPPIAGHLFFDAKKVARTQIPV